MINATYKTFYAVIFFLLYSNRKVDVLSQSLIISSPVLPKTSFNSGFCFNEPKKSRDNKTNYFKALYFCSKTKNIKFNSFLNSQYI